MVRTRVFKNHMLLIYWLSRCSSTKGIVISEYIFTSFFSFFFSYFVNSMNSLFICLCRIDLMQRLNTTFRSLKVKGGFCQTTLSTQMLTTPGPLIISFLGTVFFYFSLHVKYHFLNKNVIWKQLTSILSDLNNFLSLEFVDRVSETQLQVGENYNLVKRNIYTNTYTKNV